MRGRNNDWLLVGLRAPAWRVEACVVAGTDHVGVQARLQVVDASTLGVRMEQPTPIVIDRVDPEDTERLRGRIAESLQEPPPQQNETIGRMRPKTVHSQEWGCSSQVRLAAPRTGSMGRAQTRHRRKTAEGSTAGPVLAASQSGSGCRGMVQPMRQNSRVILK